MEDNKIIELFFERSEQAISELSSKYEKLAQMVCRNILKNQSDAEECVNDSLLSVWNTIPPERPNSLMTYFVRIARNKALDRYRYNSSQIRNSYYDSSIEELEPYLISSGKVMETCEAKLLADSINNFLSKQKKEDRIIFVGRYYYAYPTHRIAKSLNMKESTVYVRLHRICEKLRDYLRKENLI